MERERKRRRPASRRRESSPPPIKERRKPAPEVVYTAPEPINRKKLILRLATVAAVVLALFLGFSIFFKVERIVISGTEKYTAYAVEQASGIEKGDSLLALGRAKVAGRITKTLPCVKSVRIGITLPDRVNIYIEELEVVYAAPDSQNAWWLLTADGRIVEKTTESEAKKHTILEGFALRSPKAGDTAQAENTQPSTESTDESQETPSADPFTPSEKLQMALNLVSLLERNGILGEAASVNVTDMSDIQIWYGTQYQVKLGSANPMEKKIATLKAAVQEMGSYQSGVLDITYTVVKDGVSYKPFG